MMRRWYLTPLLATMSVLPLVMLTTLAPQRVEKALACTGNSAGPLETMATVRHVAVVRANVVGGAAVRAPTVAPTATPPTGSTPAAPPPFEPTASPIAFELQGIGVTFGVERVIAGSPPPSIEYAWDSRINIESVLRDNEAGIARPLSCALDHGLPRYVEGGRYLLMYSEEAATTNLYPYMTFPLEADQLVLDNQEHLRAYGFGLVMQTPTYQRYFRGIAAEEFGGPSQHRITQARVPLDVVLTAIAGLRDPSIAPVDRDPSIAPPDAGNAGLKAASG